MYYGGNEIYRYLTENGLNDRYFWTAGNMWTMLYSHQDGTPLLLCLVSRVNREEDLTQPSTQEEIRAFRRFRRLAEQARLPLLCLRFVEDGRPCERFFCKESGSGKQARLLTSAQLLELLQSYGLSLRGEQADKKVNKSTSSAFHIWQREHMGSSVIATDLDLMRMSDGVDQIYELKRSYLSLETWQPFERDRANYMAGLALAQRAGAEFRVVYNVRHTRPEFFDDISRLKVFALDDGWPPVCLGEYPIEAYFPQEQREETQ